MPKRLALSAAIISLVFSGCTPAVQTPIGQTTTTTSMTQTTSVGLTVNPPAQTPVTQQITSPPAVNPPVTQQTGFKTYTNANYGFEFTYPENLTPLNTFNAYNHLGSTWRFQAPDTSKGIPVVSILAYRVENIPNYPRYFDTEMRIGVSKDPADVRDCLLPDPDNTITPTQQTINGVTVSVIPIEDSGMMQYLEGTSYRVVHNGMCFAIEQLKNGSDYRDTPSPKDISDSVLDGYTNQVADMVQSFKFTNKKNPNARRLFYDENLRVFVIAKNRCSGNNRNLYAS